MPEKSPSPAWAAPDRALDDALVKEASELARRAPERLGAALAEWPVRRQAELALRLPADARLRLIRHAPKPMRLVRSLPAADLYLTIRELGPTDAVPLGRLASNEQITYLLDLESWRGERFDALRCGAWVAWIVEAGDSSLRRFVRGLDDEVLSLLLHSWLRVTQLEYEDGAEVHGHGMGEMGNEAGFLTPDGYHRFSPPTPEHAPAAGRFLRAFFLDQPERYQRVVWHAIWELPSELEEKALHWRQSRLEERGFPGFDDALRIYAPPTRSRERPAAPRPEDPDALGVPRLPIVAGTERALAEAIDALDPEVRDDVLHGFVSVANHLLVADYADTGDPAAHRNAAEKAGAYVRIALERRGETDPVVAGRALTETPVKELFREGYELALALHARAREVAHRGWLAGAEGAIYLVDDELRERFEALLGPRPMFVDVDERTGRCERRDFRSLDELEASGGAVEMLRVVGDVLFGLRPLEDALATGNDLHRLSTFFLTLLARHRRGDGLRLDPLDAEATADFLREVASRRTAPPDAPERALERLLETLAAERGVASRDLQVLAAFGRFAVGKLREQCSGLDPGSPVDGRFVPCLWVEPPPSGDRSAR